jgi:hypothetical protein
MAAHGQSAVVICKGRTISERICGVERSLQACASSSQFCADFIFAWVAEELEFITLCRMTLFWSRTEEWALAGQD